MTAHDKHGQKIMVGDTITFVHGGDPHTAEVQHVTEGAPGHAWLGVQIDVSIPAASTVLKAPAGHNAPKPTHLVESKKTTKKDKHHAD